MNQLSTECFLQSLSQVRRQPGSGPAPPGRGLLLPGRRRRRQQERGRHSHRHHQFGNNPKAISNHT